jgi:hypothetical protein
MVWEYCCGVLHSEKYYRAGTEGWRGALQTGCTERLEQTQLASAGDGFGAALHLEFIENIAIMPFDRTQGPISPFESPWAMSWSTSNSRALNGSIRGWVGEARGRLALYPVSLGRGCASASPGAKAASNLPI